jgi:DNA-binding response OmpR family regulator
MTGARRFLVVEDDYLVGVLIEDYLRDLDHQVVAVAATLGEALAQAREGSFDAALLDLQLGGLSGYPVADLLRGRGIPFAFVSGRADGDVLPAYAGVPMLCKPFRLGDFAAIIGRLLAPTG